MNKVQQVNKLNQHKNKGMNKYSDNKYSIFTNKFFVVLLSYIYENLVELSHVQNENSSNVKISKALILIFLKREDTYILKLFFVFIIFKNNF